MNFQENFLYFIWQFRLFNTRELFCTEGKSMVILNPGLLNKHAGPDFSQARLILDGTTWVGNIEIHIKSSDWMLHRHQYDGAFESVILHVVYHHDKPVYRKDGSAIPVLVLKGLFDEQLLATYSTMINSSNRFPCQPQIGSVPDIIVSGFLSRVLAERFEQKSAEVLEQLEVLKGDWDETFYHFMARNFGFKVNAAGFELLAGSVSAQVFGKHKDDPKQIAALVFGQAGFLAQDFAEDYPAKLKKEHNFLRKKYQLDPIDVSVWKFLRMRPQNFPTIRLAQFSALIFSSSHLFSKILEITNLKVLYELFEDLPVDNYWQTHYHFNKATKKVNLQLGRPSVRNIIINTVCLFLFSYGRYTDRQEIIDRALDFLEEMPAENNSIISYYIDSGIRPDNSFMSQALLQLNKCYCSQKKCLNCGIGIHILKK